MTAEGLQRCSNAPRIAKRARDRAGREWLIVNALEVYGPEMSLRDLGRKTNMDLTSLNEDLKRLLKDGLVVRETMPLKFHQKSPRHVWSLK